MSTNPRMWHCSVVARLVLEEAIGEFLRTHPDGYHQLMKLVAPVPPDRTEDEFKQERSDG
jgi:hypothetical protein